MHCSVPLPRYDCNCVLWQPSKHNLLAQLLIFCTLALPLSWLWGNGEIELIELCVLFFVSAGDQVLLADLVQGCKRDIENIASMISPAHLHHYTICGHSVFLSSLYLGTPSNLAPSVRLFTDIFYFLFLLFALLSSLTLGLIQCNICCYFHHTQRLITGGRKKRESESGWESGGER